MSYHDTLMGPAEKAERLGDFTLTRRSLVIAALAVPVGAMSAVLALGLLRLIGLITNLVFFGRVRTALVAPGSAPHSALVVLLAPIGGGLVVGLMARFGSERIRGHGLPETMEVILTRSSRVQPRVAVLKPISAAISIGTGGPFGAEGPIIMTGGAAGSTLAQLLHLTGDERKALLVAGAAGGMAAVFNAPLAAILLAIELLLFEWRPRSFVPVATGVVVSTLLRGWLLGTHPLFPVAGAAHIGAGDDALCLVGGVSGGLLAVIASGIVFTSEDVFRRLPIHWMWWPAIGGAIIGVGGLIEPQALGVGYNVIDALVTGRAGLSLIVGILVVKTLIWGLSLGSGTSGGVLAPTFMIGAALGALEGHVLPGVAPGFWALVGLAAVLGGVMRAPLTGIVFPLELTAAWSDLVPLVVGSVSAFAVSALLLKRSVLTEKIARRGIHLSSELSVDPLESVLVREVLADLAAGREEAAAVGTEAAAVGTEAAVGAAVRTDDTLRSVAERFATTGARRLPVVDSRDPGRTVGTLELVDLLQARVRVHREATVRERVLGRRSIRSIRSARATRDPDSG